jgi:hypothetical protein
MTRRIWSSPADLNRDETKNRFRQLVDRLNTAFSCAREADSNLQDATYYNRVEIPAAVTATGRPLWVVVSNFGGLAVLVSDISWRQPRRSSLNSFILTTRSGSTRRWMTLGTPSSRRTC